MTVIKARARMQSRMPARKVSAATAAAALSILLILALEALLGVDIPEAAEWAITVLVTYAAGYLTPPAPRDQIEEVWP